MAKMKIKADADRQMDDVKHKLTALVLLHHLRKANMPNRKGALPVMLDDNIEKPAGE